MTRSRRPVWLWIVLLLIVAATVGGVAGLCSGSGWGCYYSGVKDIKDIKEINDLLRPIIAVTGFSAVGGVWKLAERTGAPPLRRAADELAEQLGRQWDRIAAEQGLTWPAPIPVQWQWSSWPVTSPIAEAVSGIGGRRFEPLPGMAAVTAEQLRSGTLTDLRGVYGGLGSGRLIVLGEPSAGKSSAGILLLRDALAHRATVRKRDRARVPVPVLVTPQGWDPTTEPFVEWLAGSLARDYPLLQAPGYGGDAARRLIAGGHLAVILDGLDKIPEPLRREALRELNKQTFRLVVLTRTQELVAAVSDGHLQGAAALELRPIDPPQAAQYLASVLIDPPPDPWKHVIEHLDHLREHPESALAHALTTPLTLTLVRDTYGPGDAVDKLLDFPTREAIENHLLDRVLTTAYTPSPSRLGPPYTVDQARQWLGQLAHRMNKEKTRDLAWWQIPYWVSAWPRAFITVAVVGLVSVLVWLLAGLAAHMHLLPAVQTDPSTALAVVFARGLGYAFMFGFGLLLLFPPGRGSPARQEQSRWSRTEILMILLGAGVGVGTGLQNGLLNGGPVIGLLMGLVSSFVVGLGFVLGGGPPQQLGWRRWSRTDTHTNPRTGLAIRLAVGLAAGLAAGIGYGFAYGLVTGLEYGFMVGIGYLLVGVVGGRTSPQQNQLGWSGTSILTTLLIGLIITIVSTGGYGIIYVLIVLLGGRPAQQRSQLRWSRTTIPLILMGLVAGPLLSLWYWRTAGDKLELPDLAFNLALGLGFGLTAGLLVGSRPPMEATSPFDPQSLWRQERRGGLVAGLVVGLVVGLVYGLKDGLMGGLMSGLVAGLGSGLVSSATWATVLANVQLRWGDKTQDKTPVHLLRFLDDAHRRQILRTVGPVYQFQEAWLQDRLAKTYETMSEEAPDTNFIDTRPPVDKLQKLWSDSVHIPSQNRRPP